MAKTAWIKNSVKKNKNHFLITYSPIKLINQSIKTTIKQTLICIKEQQKYSIFFADIISARIHTKQKSPSSKDWFT